MKNTEPVLPALDAPFVLAPLAGISDSAFRVICREQGAAASCTEMVSAKGLYYKSPGSEELLAISPEEGIVGIQFFGSEPAMLTFAIDKVRDHPHAFININMGCPVPKVVKNGEGSALLRDPDLAWTIVKACCAVSEKPVTVKMRIGFSDRSAPGEMDCADFAAAMADAGAAAIAVHGRTREQFYSGQADWQIIAEVKKAVKVPVIANGDVRTCQDLQRILDTTGADGVMIGRGAQGNPWIFQQLTHYLRTGEVLPPPTLQERAAVIVRHLDLLLKYKGDYIGPREMRKHATWYTRGITHGAILRDKFNRAEKREDFIAILNEYFNLDLEV